MSCCAFFLEAPPKANDLCLTCAQWLIISFTGFIIDPGFTGDITHKLTPISGLFHVFFFLCFQAHISWDWCWPDSCLARGQLTDDLDRSGARGLRPQRAFGKNFPCALMSARNLRPVPNKQPKNIAAHVNVIAITYISTESPRCRRGLTSFPETPLLDTRAPLPPS